MTSSRPNAVPPAARGTSSRAASSSKARRGLLAQPRAGQGERRPGRDPRARARRRPGHGERLRQHHVIALTGEKRAGDQAQHGHLGVQSPLGPVPVTAFGRGLPDYPAGQQLPGQPVPAQLGEPVLVLPTGPVPPRLS